jgi:ABC-2 type transport system ATP-binding protein
MRLEAVSQRYGRRGPWVLRDVSLELPPPGRLVRVRGGNGGGKSTLLRLLAGVCEPSRGSVRERPRHRGYVPERFPAALPFTAHDYLCHLGRIHGLRGAEPARRAGAALERFGAAAFADTPLVQLSKGTCQKVAVAQALLAEPELLVLDEAWTGLDQQARAALDQAVAERLADGGIVLFVDHDPTRLAELPSLRWLVGAGKVHETGADQGRPTLRLTFGGRAGGSHGLAELPGVLGVLEFAASPAEEAAASPAAGTAAGAEPDRRIQLTVEAKHSDELLRLLLADPAVHIEAVQ